MTKSLKPNSPLFWCYVFAMGLSWSEITNSGVGDTYFCDMKHVRSVRQDEVTSIARERFMFQWKSEWITFGKGGYFEDYTIPLIEAFSSPETFYARDTWSLVHFKDGRFRYVTFSNCSMPCDGDEVLFIVADCSSFSE